MADSARLDVFPARTEEATKALLRACQLAVWFQYHCAQNDRSNELLDIELQELDERVQAAANSVEAVMPMYVAATSPPEAVFEFTGVCHHEIALGIVKHLVRNVYTRGHSDRADLFWPAGESFDHHKCVNDWSKVRQYMSEKAPKINEPGTLNATAEFDRLCALVRRESILTLRQASIPAAQQNGPASGSEPTEPSEARGEQCELAKPTEAAAANEALPHADEQQSEPEAGHKQNGLLHSKLRELTGLSINAFSKYVRRAGVKTPGRGKKNHCYSDDDVRKILECISDECTENRVRDRCKSALKEHFKITS